MIEKLTGVIAKFKGDGRRLGYPTANLTITTGLNDGVYFGYADLARWKRHPAVIFIGVPTTMGESRHRVEAHLLDIPDRDYYDQQLVLSIEFFHRANQTFESTEELKKVMQSDEIAARRWFANAGGHGSSDAGWTGTVAD